MKRSFLVCTAVGFATIAGAVSATTIQPDKKPPVTTPPTQPTKPTAPPVTKPDPGKQETMRQWLDQEPGPEHRALEFMIGEWDAAVKATPAPGTPATTTMGTEKNEWVLNNRFVQSHYTGFMNNAPFNGIAYMGFNDATKKYESIWMDSNSSGIMLMTGDLDAKTHTMTFSGDGEDPTGTKKHYRSITKIESNDKFVFSMMDTGPDGTESTILQITYTRKSGTHKAEPKPEVKPDTKAPAKPGK
jgi:hypothetical protein